MQGTGAVTVTGDENEVIAPRSTGDAGGTTGDAPGEPLSLADNVVEAALQDVATASEIDGSGGAGALGAPQMEETYRPATADGYGAAHTEALRLAFRPERSLDRGPFTGGGGPGGRAAAVALQLVENAPPAAPPPAGGELTQTPGLAPPARAVPGSIVATDAVEPSGVPAAAALMQIGKSAFSALQSRFAARTASVPATRGRQQPQVSFQDPQVQQSNLSYNSGQANVSNSQIPVRDKACDK